LHRGLSGLEADLGVSSIAERFVHRPSTAAESDRLFPAGVVLVAVDVSELKLAQVPGNKIRPVRFWHDFYRPAGPPRELSCASRTNKCKWLGTGMQGRARDRRNRAGSPGSHLIRGIKSSRSTGGQRLRAKGQLLVASS